MGGVWGRVGDFVLTLGRAELDFIMELSVSIFSLSLASFSLFSLSLSLNRSLDLLELYLTVFGSGFGWAVLPILFSDMDYFYTVNFYLFSTVEELSCLVL